MENLEIMYKMLESRYDDVVKELEKLREEKLNMEIDKEVEIASLKLENKNLMTELKYNRISVKYLRDTNEHLLEMIKDLKENK